MNGLVRKFQNDINNFSVTESLLYDVIYDAIYKYKLKDYVINFDIHDESLINSQPVAYYRLMNKKIGFNLDRFLTEISHMDFYKQKCTTNRQELMYNIYNILFQTIYHELTHARQYKWINETCHSSQIQEILFKTLIFKSQQEVDNYHKYNYLYPCERQAEIFSLIETNKLLNSLGYINNRYNLVLINKLIRDYTTSSPIETLYENNVLEPKTYKLDTFNSLVLGLPVDRHIINKLSNNKEQITNVKRYIKKM